MTEEEREVYEALMYEGDDDAYEELEDEFVVLANDGCVPLKPKNFENQPSDIADDIKQAIEKADVTKKKDRNIEE